MTPDTNTATIRECIVEVAIIKHGSRTGYGEHMGQPTIDAAIAAMPKGWDKTLWIDVEGDTSADAQRVDGVKVKTLWRSVDLPTTAWRLCLAMHIAEGRGK